MRTGRSKLAGAGFSNEHMCTCSSILRLCCRASGLDSARDTLRGLPGSGVRWLDSELQRLEDSGSAGAGPVTQAPDAHAQQLAAADTAMEALLLVGQLL